MSVFGPPHPLERWQENKRPFRIRTVMERDINGDVIFITGKVNNYAGKERCTEKEWREWAVNSHKK